MTDPTITRLNCKSEIRLTESLAAPRFRQRIQGIVEAFETLQRDLDAERKVITKQWAKREAQIERVMQGTIGMYGDLQGIAGQGLKEIEGLEAGGVGGQLRQGGRTGRRGGGWLESVPKWKTLKAAHAVQPHSSGCVNNRISLGMSCLVMRWRPAFGTGALTFG